MKRLFYPVAFLLVFSACRHQAVTASANADNYTNQSSQQTTTTTTTTTTPANGGTTTTTDPANSGTTTTVTTGNGTSTGTTTTVDAGGNTGGTGNGGTTTTVSAQTDTSNIYRVSVSFISRGEGIDYKTQETFENWLAAQPKHPAYMKTHWGREGETNYCLKLNELSTREQEIFVRDLRTLLTDKPLVLINEYAECKGRPE